MKHKECWWFHRWLYLGKVMVIEPKLGPFDPRTDAERERAKKKYVCVDCGKERTTFSKL